MQQPMTLPELCDKLRSVDEVLLVELLGLNSSDLVNAFLDIIEEQADRLLGELEEYE